MLKHKHLILFILIFTLISLLCSCGETACTEHIDENMDKICDNCGEKTESTPDQGQTGSDNAVIIDNKVMKFAFVTGSDINSEVMQTLDKVYKAFSKDKIEITKLTETDTPAEYEILIGTVSGRDAEYTVDKYSLGKNGYIIKLIDKKIVIQGGSPESLSEAIDEFSKKILKIKDGNLTESTVTMKPKDSIDESITSYRITSVKIDGNSITDYVIVAEKSNVLYYNAAKNIQNALYENAGYWIPIVSSAEDGQKAILIQHVDDAGENGFIVKVDSKKNLNILCAYDNKFTGAVGNFITKNFVIQNGDVNLKGTVYTENISRIYYSEFGAKGDGVTDDFAAIKAAHDEANTSGQTVYADSGKTYYIKNASIEGKDSYVTIMTDVYWGSAKFIIDDTTLDWRQSGQNKNHIFYIKSPYEKITIKGDKLAAFNLENIGRETTKIDLGLGYKAVLYVYNDNHKVYIRYGGNANNGANQCEMVVVDENGNIDPSTSFLLDYEEVTKIVVQRFDLKPLTVDGGEFTNRACRVLTTENGNATTVYYSRGICAQRCNTIVKNVKQYNVGEYTKYEQASGLTSVSYSGFYYASDCSDVTFQDCIMSGRRYYGIAGTYGFGAARVNNIILKGCVQSNFYKEDGITVSTVASEYWGLGGTNYCKNMIYEDCILTRYDAHSGVYNGKIINSKLSMINLIGGGDMIIKNTVVENDKFITLRSDYGSTWRGTIYLDDCTLKTASTGKLYVLTYTYANHYFGYPTFMPNVVINNMRVEGSNTTLYVLKPPTVKDAHKDLINGADINLNKVTGPSFIKIVTNKYGTTFKLDEHGVFDNTETEGITD